MTLTELPVGRAHIVPAAGTKVQEPAYLAARGLTKSFTTAGRKAVVVDVLSLDIRRSEFVCVLGPSGCGKTTLLRLIAGFERADAGAIHQDGREITGLEPENRDFGIVFQSYALFPNRTVAQNIAYGLESIRTPTPARAAKVAELLALVGLADHAGKYPSQISGGQQQRVALARALALSPGLLLLDEPLSALDANVRIALRDELRALQKRVGVTTLMVTHDQQEALSVADRLVIMNHGRIEQEGAPGEVYDRPANLFVARFLGPMNALPIEAVGAGTARAAGMTFHVDDRSTGAGYLAIRPAAVMIGEEAKGQANGFRAKVTDVAFLGDLMRIAVRLPHGDGSRLLHAETHRARLLAEPDVGEMLDVALPARHCRLLDDGTGA
ncbi:MAG: ABC transporter ATP-binding protein [Beijerinckiaceae bacterium]